MKAVKTVLPAVHVRSNWDHKSSVYPDSIEVPMVDGAVVEYVINTKQPHPSFTAVMGLLEKLPVYGPSAAGYKGRHEKEE